MRGLKFFLRIDKVVAENLNKNFELFKIQNMMQLLFSQKPRKICFFRIVIIN